VITRQGVDTSSVLNPAGLHCRIHYSRLNPCDFGSLGTTLLQHFCNTFKGIHMQTKHKLASIGVAMALSFAAIPSFAQVMVGGAPMLASKDIIDNAVNSKDHTTLVAAVKAAGLVDTLKGPGPFTVFAPTNAAFAALPAGTVDTLLKPENKGMLTGILTYHVVAGKWDAAAISKMIGDGKGMASIKTVAGGTLVAKSAGGKVTVTDEKGGVATVTIADVYQSNGVIHVVDKVLLPK
jgi:uncharacterized surface protein with fasciclin (FAS1) repeats